MTRVLYLIGRGLRGVLVAAVAFALFLIVALVFYQVITRYLTGTATPGLAEVSRFLFIWLVFAGGAWLVSRGELIAIDFFSGKMGPKAYRALRIFVDACTGVLLVALLTFSEKLLDIVATKHAPATGLPYVWVYAALPTFAAICLFFLIERAATTRFFATIPSSLVRED